MHIQIKIYIDIHQNIYKEKSLINLSAVFADLRNTLKFPMLYHINQVYCCPDNM